MASIIENITMLNQEIINEIKNNISFQYIHDQATEISNTISNTFNDLIYTNIFSEENYKPFAIPSFDNTIIPMLNIDNLINLLANVLLFTFTVIDIMINEIINNQDLILKVLALLFICIVLINYEGQNLRIKKMQETIKKMDNMKKKNLNSSKNEFSDILTQISDLETSSINTFSEILIRLTEMEIRVEELDGCQKTQKNCITAMERKMRKLQKDLYNEY